MAKNVSHKRVLVEKSNQVVFVVICIATAMVIFAFVSVRSLYQVSDHNAKVIKEKRIAEKQLKTNDTEISKLITEYIVFENTPESVIGTTDKNSKIILDSLPPKYDFPGLVTSLEKILTEGGYNIVSISGVDNEVNEVNISSPKPQPVEVPFSIEVSGNYEKIKNLPGELERSIRTINVTNLQLSGTASDARLRISAKTYYQAGKNLDIRYKEVR